MSIVKKLAAGLGVFALLIGSAMAQSQYPLVTVEQIQKVTDFTQHDDDSPLVGDTVRVEVVAVGHPRSLWVGARWSFYAYQDTVGENGEQLPWTGIMVIQHDTTKTGTLMNAVQPGDKIIVTGVVAEYPSGAGRFSQTQLEVLTNPEIPIEFVGTVDPDSFPKPVTLTAADLADLEGAEKWEAALVRVENLTVVNNDLPGGTMLLQDAEGNQVTVDDQYWFFHGQFLEGNNPWPVPGTRLNVTGHVRDYDSHMIAPRNDADLEILTNPPVIQKWTRDPAAPTSSDAVTVSAQITDNGTVDSAFVVYSVENGPFQAVAMTAPEGDSVYSAQIPPQADGSFVKYYLRAVDNDGDVAIMPDTTGGMFFYIVRDAGLSIYDIQWTPFAYDNSGYEGMEVTVKGIVVTDSTDFPNAYVIMDAAEPWHGVLVRDGAHSVTLGDEVQITGTVQEYYGMTRLNYLTDFQLLSVGNEVPGPIVVHTGDLATGAPTAESYENCLVEVRDVTVADPFPDAPSNYGEFTVDDGTGAVRVDDAGNFNGNRDSTFAQGDHIDVLRGVLWYTYGNYKIEPRNEGDIIGHTTGVEEAGSGVPATYSLSQNYPNPFNPTTQIRYSLAKAGQVRIDVYNLQGQRVRTLVNAQVSAGVHQVVWDGKDESGRSVASGLYIYRLRAGDVVMQKKMLLLK